MNKVKGSVRTDQPAIMKRKREEKANGSAGANGTTNGIGTDRTSADEKV